MFIISIGMLAALLVYITRRISMLESSCVLWEGILSGGPDCMEEGSFFYTMLQLTYNEVQACLKLTRFHLRLTKISFYVVMAANVYIIARQIVQWV